MTPSLVLQLVLTGIQVGSIYALVALGVVLLYRTSKILNFAHGELSLIAAFVAFTLTTSAGLPLVLAAPIALAVAGTVAAGTRGAGARCRQPRFRG